MLGWASSKSTSSKLKLSPMFFASSNESGMRGSSTLSPSSPAMRATMVPCPSPVSAKEPKSPMRAMVGCSPKIARARSPSLTAPAVWLLEGPTMTGPMMSNMLRVLAMSNIITLLGVLQGRCKE